MSSASGEIAPPIPPPPAARELKPWNFIAVMLLCLAVQVVVVIAWIVITVVPPILAGEKPSQPPEPPPALFLVLQPIDILLGLGGAWAFACAWTKRTTREGFRLAAPSRLLGVTSAAAGAVCIGLQCLLLKLDPSGAPKMMAQLTSTPLGFWTFVVLGAFSPFFEEIYYRVFMFDAFENAIGTAASAILVTVWFLGLHVPQYWPSLGGIASIFILSLTTTILRVKTRSVVPSMIAHAVFNWTAIAVAVVFRGTL